MQFITSGIRTKRITRKPVFEGGYGMQKGKKSDVNKQQVNIGTKRTDRSDKQRKVEKEKGN